MSCRANLPPAKYLNSPSGVSKYTNGESSFMVTPDDGPNLVLYSTRRAQECTPGLEKSELSDCRIVDDVRLESCINLKNCKFGEGKEIKFPEYLLLF